MRIRDPRDSILLFLPNQVFRVKDGNPLNLYKLFGCKGNPIKVDTVEETEKSVQNKEE